VVMVCVVLHVHGVLVVFVGGLGLCVFGLGGLFWDTCGGWRDYRLVVTVIWVVFEVKQNAFMYLTKVLYLISVAVMLGRARVVDSGVVVWCEVNVGDVDVAL
jgi:hypothetical protein